VYCVSAHGGDIGSDCRTADIVEAGGKAAGDDVGSGLEARENAQAIGLAQGMSAPGETTLAAKAWATPSRQARASRARRRSPDSHRIGYIAAIRRAAPTAD
jgi:hypothetical protein